MMRLIVAVCALWLIAADAATLRVNGLPVACRALQSGADLVVQCPDGKGKMRDRVTYIDACPKPPRTENTTTDGGLLVNCNRKVTH